MRGDAKRSKRSLDVKASNLTDEARVKRRLKERRIGQPARLDRTERRRRSINQPFEPADSQAWLDFPGPSPVGRLALARPGPPRQRPPGSRSSTTGTDKFDSCTLVRETCTRPPCPIGLVLQGPICLFFNPSLEPMDDGRSTCIPSQHLKSNVIEISLIPSPKHIFRRIAHSLCLSHAVL